MSNYPVEDWFWEELDDDDRDELRDRISRLENVQRAAWTRPGFDKLDSDICEIQKTTSRGEMRVYGYFPPGLRYHFVLLFGHYKKVKNDKHGKQKATDRLKQLRQGKGHTHEFNFKKRPDRSGKAGSSGP